jgi:hypothetical protein
VRALFLAILINISMSGCMRASNGGVQGLGLFSIAGYGGVLLVV